MAKRKQIQTGDVFGRRVAVSEEFIKGRYRFVEMRCACGNVSDVEASGLTRGRYTQCLRCRFASYTGETNPSWKHGGEGSRLYIIWSGIKKRTGNVRCKNFHRYGGRAPNPVTVCDEWKDSFPAFREWSLANGYADHLSIDRINNATGNYSPGECRWIDQQAQMRNTRRNVHITACGTTAVLAAWAEDPRCQVVYSTLCKRIRAGWNHTAAVLLPPHSKRTDPIPTLEQLTLFTK